MTESDREGMARVIMLSCSTRMKPETAMHYANNLIAAGYGKAEGPVVTTSMDGLKIRERLGRTEWDVPRPFGPDGWSIDRKDGAARIIVTLGPTPDPRDGAWLHASISTKDRIPTYDELVMLHKAVWPNGWAIQVFAPPSEHINIHPYALHLFGQLDGGIFFPNFGAEGTI